MPSGYLVQQVDTSLDPGDSIVDPLFTFTTDTNLGAGHLTCPAMAGGATYINEFAPGDYALQPTCLQFRMREGISDGSS